ncbi:MAG: PQQ-binding-like beta-propeller repeat protein [Gemmataceae bacterium]
MKRCIICWSVLWLTAPAWASDWLQFRGPDGQGIAHETNLPEKWSQTENVRWKVDLPGRGLSSPVIANGRVFVTACSGPTQSRLHVLCFDLATGKKLWERQFWATGSTSCHPKTNMAAPTPVSDGKYVYALFATCDLACLDADGNLQWYRALRKDYPTVSNNVGMAASPIIWNDLLIIQMENVGESFAAGIDKRTGQNRWKIDRGKIINWVTPIVVRHNGQPQLLLQSPDQMTAHDPRTGKELWSFKPESGLATIPSSTAGDDLILVPGGELLALKPKNKGEPEVVWTSNRLKPATATPVSYGGRIYSVNSAGVLNCAEAATGKILWQERLKGPYSASPIIADGKLYIVNEAGTTAVVQLGDEPKVLAMNDLGETILGTPSFADGAIFLRSDEHLYCIGNKQQP